MITKKLIDQSTRKANAILEALESPSAPARPMALDLMEIEKAIDEVLSNSHDPKVWDEPWFDDYQDHLVSAVEFADAAGSYLYYQDINRYGAVQAIYGLTSELAALDAIRRNVKAGVYS